MLSPLSSFRRLVCCSTPKSLLMAAWLSESCRHTASNQLMSVKIKQYGVQRQGCLQQ